ncbi:hypothetical protein B0H13DRAFT_1997301 [Mycena leptocephala]|nr:hypothetical protein B0H13DRAFT_1997301 [Mycena leptocephala]
MLDRAQATIAMRLDSRVLAASSNVVDQGLSAATTAQSAYQRVQSFSDMVWVGAALKSVDVLVKFVDGITDAHPAFKLGWTILSYVYKRNDRH